MLPTGLKSESTPSVTLFLTEDQVAVRDVLAAYLGAQPGLHVVGEASDGRETVARCQELHPDVLVLDYRIPDMDGAQVAETLKRHAPEMKILFFTACLDLKSVRAALAAGASGIVEKTAHAEVLLEAIVAVASDRTYFTPHVMAVMQEALAQPAQSSPAAKLTGREKEVLKRVAEGCSNKEIAADLGVGLRTVENHRWHLMRKLKARNAADLTRAAFELGLI